MSNEYNHATHEMSTKEEASQRWPMYSKIWSCDNEAAQKDLDDTNMIQMNQVFTNQSKEEGIYPLTLEEIVEA